MDTTLKALTPADVDHVRWALYEAVAWDPDRELPPFELTIEHPELARYHRDWGRPGDLGVAAELGGEVVGVALCRIFTEDDHGHGYVEEQTPELAVAVADERRDRGIGKQLLEALADAARAAGLTQLSLSVDAGNPAVRLYERAGYRELTRDEDGIRMLLEL